ncbi:Planctomycete cytochrome C [Rosistilla carotiformis]|uniref:Planctomycete cytochrome C n=1 Tax=Rosistilla carotiformis TaxID=2528017 RepID=A0A518JV50_9BACT|nr:DUF1553 domain-containing protein [Rosistilla carotiformis]QDV69407.1 Planctomycete cytochrome C [Rosistilla carotiformis]
MNRLRSIALSLLILATGTSASANDGLAPADVEFFEAKIRPVLVEHCYECHNSESTAEAELALDWRKPLRTGGQSGPSLAEAASDSFLLKVMRHEVEGLEMPEGGEKLSDAILADFETWIAKGAADPRDAPPSAEELAKSTSWEAVRDKRAKWWSFQPIAEVTPPQSDNGWSDAPIDRFTYEKMQAAGLQPADPADRVTLVRRLYFALTGLPPTPQQIDAFVGDAGDDAYETLVDELLQSPHFGERWARHWMDWFRYAQSHGSEGDPRIAGATRYRDYLIRALNRDVPYDQLVREHIAGDRLSEPRIDESLGINESLIGTAHWRMVFHGFAPTDALDERVRFTDDAIDVVSKAFLGLTVSCARCHNHKFDAISQADYYAFAGIVGSTRPGRAAIDLPGRLNRHRETLAKLKPKIRDAIVADWQPVVDGLAERLTSSPASESDAQDLHAVLRPWAATQRAVDAGESFATAWQRQIEEFETLQSQRAAFDEPSHPYDWQLGEPDAEVEWFAYGNGLVAESGRESQRQPRRTSAGEFAISESGAALRGIYPAGVVANLISNKHAAVLTSEDFRVADDQRLWVQIAGDGASSARFVVQNYPRNGTVYPVTNLSGEKASRWHWQQYDLSYWSGDDLHIELATARDAPLLVKDNDRSWFGIRRAVVTDPGQQPPAEWREHLTPLFASALEKPPASLDALAANYATAIGDAIQAWQAGTMTDPQALLLDACVQQNLLPNGLDQLPSAKPLIDEYRRLEAEIPVPRRVPTLAEWKGSDHPLYIRGDHKQPDQPIPRRFLEAFDAEPYPTDLSGREQLAEDLVRDDNPLTARVIVNRIWHHLFGRGIVATTDNFGRLGVPPTHPELLDYLANNFRDNAWSIKQLIRQIVTSETWRQQSTPSAKVLDVDPDNLWLSYRTTSRLEAEAIRDSLLLVSGRLQTTPPEGAVRGDSDRRSVYVNVIRNSLDPFLSSFDAPVPFSCKGRRDVTNVPAQALMMLNNPFVLSAAQRLSQDILTDESLHDPAQRVGAIWRRCFGRSPSDSELKAATGFLQQSQAANEAIRQQIAQWDREIAQQREQIDQITLPARDRLLAALKSPTQTATAVDDSLPTPLRQWEFGRLESDAKVKEQLTLHGTARIQDGALIVDGGGWAASAALPESIGAKSLEVVVQLDDLEQHGGAAISLQTTDGVLFDAIVFAEREPRRWMSGSDHGRRTQNLQAVEEDLADQQPIHLVITYGKDGTVACYRNGQIYGTPYKTGVQSFPAGRTQVILGMRHGVRTTGGRMLKGRIYDARLYDVALSETEVQALGSRAVNVITREQIIAALEPAQREQLSVLETQLATLQRQRDETAPAPGLQQHWIDFAHSLLNMKEFLYVR